MDPRAWPGSAASVIVKDMRMTTLLHLAPNIIILGPPNFASYLQQQKNERIILFFLFPGRRPFLVQENMRVYMQGLLFYDVCL